MAAQAVSAAATSATSTAVKETDQKVSPKSGVGRPDYSWIGSRVIKLVAGESRLVLNVHEGLLRHYSSYFDNALKGNFEEATSGQFILDDELEEVVKAFVRFLYSGIIFDGESFKGIVRCNQEQRQKQISSTYWTLLRVWLFGDKRDIPDLQDCALFELHYLCVHARYDCCKKAVREIYQRYRSDINLTKYFVEFAVYHQLNVSSAELPADFLEQMVTMQRELLNKGTTSKKLNSREDFQTAFETLDICKFHMHGSDKPCTIGTSLLSELFGLKEAILKRKKANS